MRKLLPILAAATLLLAVPAEAQQADLQAKLRDALRAATAQIRALEDEKAALLAKQSQLESQLQALQGQGSATSGKAVAAEYERVFAEREQAYKLAVDEFNQRLQEERDQLIRMQDAAQKWKAAHDETAAALRAKEGERQQLAQQAAATNARIERCQAQNQALFAVSNEILDRYRNVGVTDVLAAHEPFLGLKRVELENLMQDYDDRVLDSRFDPNAPLPAPPAAESASAPSADPAPTVAP